MGLSKKEQKMARKSSKEQQKRMIDYHYALETKGDPGAQEISREAKLKLLREKSQSSNNTFTRLTTPIRLCAAQLTLWWLWIVVSLPLDAGVRLMLVLASAPLLWLVSGLVSYLMKRKRRDGVHMLPLAMDPPILLFVTLMAMQFTFRVGAMLDQGAIGAALAEEVAKPSGLDVAMLCAIPTVFALFVVMLLLVILPTLASEEQMLGFNELQQYHLYIAVSCCWTLLRAALALYAFA